MIKGQAGQIVGVQLNLVAGGPYTGAVQVYVDGDHTGQALGATAGGVGNNRGNGSYDYVVAASDVAYNHIAFTFKPTGAGSSPETFEVDTITPSQISALQTATGLSSVQVSDLVVEAAIEVRVVRAGGTLEPGVARWILGKLNRMLDRWNADPAAKYNVGFSSYVPVLGGHQPQTIGPNSADWTVAGRPTNIKGANLILNTSTPSVRLSIEVRDEQWWLQQTVQGIRSAIVTDLYYSDDWPNGSVYLWPVPTAAYPIELLTDTLFGNMQITDTLWLPFGYRDAITSTLAVEIAPGLGQTPTDELKAAATDARVVVFGNNVQTRNAKTRDGGMPGGRRGATYLYRTGGFKQGN